VREVRARGTQGLRVGRPARHYEARCYVQPAAPVCGAAMAEVSSPRFAGVKRRGSDLSGDGAKQSRTGGDNGKREQVRTTACALTHTCVFVPCGWGCSPGLAWRACGARALTCLGYFRWRGSSRMLSRRRQPSRTCSSFGNEPARFVQPALLLPCCSMAWTRFPCPQQPSLPGEAVRRAPEHSMRRLLAELRFLRRPSNLQIEEALYSLCKGITPEYTEKAKALKFNLAKNKELREDVLSQQIEPDALVAMRSADLADRAKKSVRESAKAESLQETINNDELKNLKEAAAGLSLRKTDAGLAVVDADAEKAKREAEDSERRKLEEERIRAAVAASEKQVLTTVEVKFGADDANAYLTSNWVPTPKAAGAGNEDSDDEEAQKKTELVISSPVLESQPADSHELETLADLEGDEDEEDAAKPVWDGDLDFANKKRSYLYPEQQSTRPLRLRAYPLQDEGELHHPIFPRVHVQGYISLNEMEKYIATKRQESETKMVLAFKLVARQHSRAAYDTLVEEMRDKKKGICLINEKNWGVLYCLPSTSPSVSSLLGFGEADCLVAVAITNRGKPDSASKRKEPADLRQEVTNDFAKATGTMEKTVMLSLKKSSLNLRLRAIAGDVALDHVPDELKDESKAHVGGVIEFLLTQKVSVMEVEPEGEKDEEEHFKLIETLVDKKRAAVVLDTEKALMYLVPPVDEAGKLLDPPSTSCDSLLGVLLLSQEDANASSDPAASVGAASASVGAGEEGRVPNPAPPATSAQQQVASGAPLLQGAPDAGNASAARGNHHAGHFTREGMPGDRVPLSGRPPAPKDGPPAPAPVGQWPVVPQNQTNLRGAAIPAPISINQAPLDLAPQSPFDPSPRPSYVALHSPSIPAPGPPLHGAAGRGNLQQRGPHTGWQDNAMFPMQGRFVGDNRPFQPQGQFVDGRHPTQNQPRERDMGPDPRQWQHNGSADFQNMSPRNMPSFGLPNGLPFAGFDARNPPMGGAFGGPPLGGGIPTMRGGHMQGNMRGGEHMGRQQRPPGPNNPQYDGFGQGNPRNFRR